MINWTDLEAANATLNAFIDFDESAQFGDGPLDGLTIGVKSNIAVNGLPWTGGLECFRNRIAEQDAEVVTRLRKAGAAITGTLNMEEAALGAKTDNPFYGATQNPHRIGHTPGGSSGGSGAAVAAGLCDAALGTDTMGSVRIPASYCGVYGFKPAQGNVSQNGMELVEASLDTIGPLARSLDVLEQVSHVISDNFGNETKDGTIALLENLGDVECEPAILDTYHKAKRASGATTHFTLPHPLSRIRFAGFILSSLGLSKELAQIISDHPEQLSENLKNLMTFGPKRKADDLTQDKAILTGVSDMLHSILEKHIAIMLPTAPQTAFAHSENAPANQADFTCLASVAGLPAISIPAGWSDDALPIGMQLVGAPGREQQLFDLARALDKKLNAYRAPDNFTE